MNMNGEESFLLVFYIATIYMRLWLFGRDVPRPSARTSCGCCAAACDWRVLRGGVRLLAPGCAGNEVEARELQAAGASANGICWCFYGTPAAGCTSGKTSRAT